LTLSPNDGTTIWIASAPVASTFTHCGVTALVAHSGCFHKGSGTPAMDSSR